MIIDPEKTAIIGRDFAQAVAGKNIRFDSTATIQLTSYAPNKLTYKTKASQEQLAVFSEVNITGSKSIPAPMLKNWAMYPHKTSFLVI